MGNTRFHRAHQHYISRPLLRLQETSKSITGLYRHILALIHALFLTAMINIASAECARKYKAEETDIVCQESVGKTLYFAEGFSYLAIIRPPKQFLLY